MSDEESPGPDLKGTLGTLLRTTLGHAGSLRSALEREAGTAKDWVDGALLLRRQKEELAELGRKIFDRIQQGECEDLVQIPDIAATIDSLVSLSETISARQAVPAPKAPSPPAWRSEEEPARGGDSASETTFVDDPLEDDEDLEDYMHENDVPKRESSS